MFKSAALCLLAFCLTLGSASVFAEDATQQIEEMTVMGAVKSRDAGEAADIEAADEQALEELPVIEE
ncbi:hypothetical protein SAMN02745866_03079 [Alteromonadaceae bacterium Bs31]|nr:hypothetical protein SAMN02745866_03079 [Alteromonadaceae bacterium Bs31]